MQSKEITQRLIDGSKNIDNMKKEVEQVVRMVIGYKLNGLSAMPLIFSKDFPSSGIVWHLEADLSSPDSRRRFITVNCKEIQGDETSKSLFFVSSHSNVAEFPTQTTQLVYEGLHVFVGGMLEAYPELANYWEPLIKASYKLP